MHQEWHNLSCSLIRQGLDFVFPPLCPGCECPFSDIERRQHTTLATVVGSPFCPDCRDQLVQNLTHVCERCSAVVGPHSQTSSGCVHCRGKTLHFKSVTCLGMYEGALRDTILSSKWSRSTVCLESLAALFCETQHADLSDHSFDLIIPIPQSWNRRLVRHFNPADVVAARLGRSLNVPLERHVLRRSRMTRLQKRVSVSQRFENQRNSFRLRDRHIIKDQRVLIVDDVLTTGATCSEAARLLKQNGASTCHVAVLARVLDHSA